MFKLLGPAGCTYRDNKPFIYNLPHRGEKWAVTEHPDPVEPDGEPCGPGRLHLMKGLNALYAPVTWWPWWAQGINLVGEDHEKAAYQAMRLRRITKCVFWRALRPPFNWGCRAGLSRANLSRADLRGADLSVADLTEADLSRADLRGADLTAADLRGADLRGADLSGAKLSWADLSKADLAWTGLSNADLSNADLGGANLRGANPSEANLHGAVWNEYTTWPNDFNPDSERQGRQCHSDTQS